MIEKNTLIPENTEVYGFLGSIYAKAESTLIAISWWADSIYVSLIIQQYREYKNRDTKKIHYIYCDHNIRKENNDKLYIQKYVNKEQLHVVTRQKKEKNTESSLRKRRYEQIQKYMKQHNIKKLITGHHLSDRIESTFLNILRGCAIDWFISMHRIEKNSHLIQWEIIRPLLKMWKEHIKNICDKHNIQYSNDDTNNDITISKRNRLRHTILKELKELSHNSSSDNSSFENSMLEIYTAIESMQENEHPIQIETIPMYKHRNTKRAYKWNIHPKDITTNHIKKICKQLHIQNNMGKKNMKELSDFLQKKKKWHKYINYTYFFLSHWAIYIINGPKKFWEAKIQNTENIQDLFDQVVMRKTVNKRRFSQHEDKIHGKSIKKRCINQKIPMFWRENIIVQIQKNWSIAPVIRDFMKSK